MSDTPTMRESVLAIVDTGRPELRFAYPRTFVVRAVRDDGRIDIDPPPDAADLQPIDRVEQWATGGTLYTPAVGALCVVIFRDARETRPVIVGFAPEAAGPAAARTGDLVVRLYFDTLTSTLYKSESVGAPYAWTAVLGAIIPPSPAESGTPVTIAAGSGKVRLA